MSERRKELMALYKDHILNRERINSLIGLADASFQDDLRATLRLADIGRLRLLRRALAEDRVIRQSFRGFDDTGCWGYFAFGWRSREEFLSYDYPSEEGLFAAVRAVRGWDFQRPGADSDTITRIVDEVVMERLQLNVQESATIRRAAVRSSRKTQATSKQK